MHTYIYIIEPFSLTHFLVNFSIFFNNIIHNISILLKNIEKKIAKKCVNLKGSIKFNRTCLNNGLYPKFVHIYIYIYVCVYYILHIS